MEYLPNGDLHEHLVGGRPSFDSTVGWIREAAWALDAAHRLALPSTMRLLPIPIWSRWQGRWARTTLPSC